MRISDDQVIEVDDKKNKNKNEINKEEVLKQIEDDKKKEENKSKDKVKEFINKNTSNKGKIKKDGDVSKEKNHFDIKNFSKKLNLKDIKANDNKFKYIMIFLLGMIIAFAGFYCFNDYLVNNKETSASVEEELSAGIEKVYDAVVYIENYRVNRLYTSGTGFVYKVDDDNGYILTNYHVVKDSTSIKITLANDKVVEARYLGGDEYLDIACLAIDKSDVLATATLGSSANTKLGATLFTVGTPVGDEYRGTVTRGILSGKDRLVSVSTSGSEEDYVMKVLQTDAAMNPGNSGGPLCNIKGEVIGINSMKLVKDEVEGMAFAIAIENVKDHLETFEQGKNIDRPYLGVAIFNLQNKSTLEYYGLDQKIDTELEEGVVIQSVEDDGSASGKLEAGDIVVKVNDVPISNVAYFRYELFKNEVGDKVTITVERDGKLKDIDITLKAK